MKHDLNASWNQHDVSKKLSFVRFLLRRHNSLTFIDILRKRHKF